MTLLDGKNLSERILADLKKQVSAMAAEPVLAMVRVGEDPASKVYIRKKKDACEEIGIEAHEINLPAETSQETLIEAINALNSDRRINAIIVQLPLPASFDRYAVLEKIRPEKDADCLSPLNFGNFFQKGEANFPIGPATPVGIIRLLEEYEITVEKKYAVLVGYSDIVGKPLSEMLLARGATVTVCHDKTHDLADFTSEADILVSATGVKNLITADMVREGVIAVDVGISREGEKIFGDIDFEAVKSKASFLSPVPGGVGPMTVAILLKNVVRLTELQLKKIGGVREKTEDIKTQSEIKAEFEQLLDSLGDQGAIISELKSRVAKAKTKLELSRKEENEIFTRALQTLEKILAEKPSRWLPDKERFASKLKGLAKKLETNVRTKIKILSKYDLSSELEESEAVDQVKNFDIPSAYDDYYDSTKKFLENKMSNNDKVIRDLELKDRELEEKIIESERNIQKMLNLISEWENWIGNRFQDTYERVDDFYLGANMYFEEEREKLLEVEK